MKALSKRNRAVLLMAVCGILWSLAGILIKYIPWHPIEIAGGRSVIATVIVYGYMRATGMRVRLNRASVLSGMFLAATFTTFVSANKLTTAANAIVLQFSAPVFIMLISSLFYKQRFRREDYAVVAVTLLGIAFCFYGQLSGGSLLGNVIAVVSGLFFGAMFAITGNTDPESRMSGILLGHVIMAVVSIPFFALAPPVYDGKALLCIAILGVVQLGIPYILYSVAVEQCSPLVCSLISVIEPLLNPLWVFLFYRENPGASSLIGGVIVIGTITIWTLRANRRAE
jgi:drug/metabolite transporter (DMT)-like permease